MPELQVPTPSVDSPTQPVGPPVQAVPEISNSGVYGGENAWILFSRVSFDRKFNRKCNEN